ncbi:hypothetical protein MesoLj131c_67830 (plasmid) [Mesorhizobium sp. 131-3-5]|nr:hypothetical protein MesoLj131c_67830 [Mesorhizobium sp. 131-3-5]
MAFGMAHWACRLLSGTVTGIMFDPASESTAEKLELAVRDLRNEGFEASVVTQ